MSACLFEQLCFAISLMGSRPSAQGPEGSREDGQGDAKEAQAQAAPRSCDHAQGSPREDGIPGMEDLAQAGVYGCGLPYGLLRQRERIACRAYLAGRGDSQVADRPPAVDLSS